MAVRKCAFDQTRDDSGFARAHIPGDKHKRFAGFGEFNVKFFEQPLATSEDIGGVVVDVQFPFAEYAKALQQRFVRSQFPQAWTT